MRVLVTFTGGRGHLEPLVPVARAAAAAGHTVAFAGRPGIVAVAEAVGFTTFPTGEDVSADRVPLRPVDVERDDRVLRDAFAGRIARERADDLLAIAGRWRPDLVVCDEIDFGAMVAAERLQLPYATMLVVAAGSFVRRELIAEPLEALRAAHGLPPDPDLAMLRRYLVLSPFPPGFRDPRFPLPETAHGVRLAGATPAASGDRRPIVYFTLGTVVNIESGDLFSRVLAGLHELPVSVIATVGPQIDPAELGPLREGIRVERYLDQWAVLPRCSAVVCHGGSGTVLGALAHGLPLVVIPLGADQPLNASRCEEVGAGRALDAVGATPALVSEVVSAVLNDPSYRLAAERLRDELAALPGPAHAVTLLERLARERGPVSEGGA